MEVEADFVVVAALADATNAAMMSVKCILGRGSNKAGRFGIIERLILQH